MYIFFKGFFLGASLIIAIGVQNAFILRQGLKNRHVLASVLTASICDVALIALGVAGFGAIVESMPAVIDAIKWFAFLFLMAYGLKSFFSAFKKQHLDNEIAKNMAQEADVKQTILIVLGVSLLNPHVYLDTVVLLGGLSSAYGDPGRYIFGAGALCASVAWFFSLGYGARLLAPIFQKPKAWQILDILIGLVMWGIAFSLVYEDLLNVLT